jgi:hypothetical protein
MPDLVPRLCHGAVNMRFGHDWWRKISMIVARVILPFLITSLSANAGIIGDRLGNLPILLLPGMDGGEQPGERVRCSTSSSGSTGDRLKR